MCNNYVCLYFQGISVDLSTLRAEWESRSAAASGGNALNGQLSGSFCQLSSLNDGSSVSGSGNDVNEEIDVVGGLDSCSESGSERVDSAADGSVDGEFYPILSNDRNDPERKRWLGGNPSIGGTDHLGQNPNAGLGGNHNLDVNHQQGIRHWGLSLLERRRELDTPTFRRTGSTTDHRNCAMISHSIDRTTNDDEVQSSSIDLSVKGREEIKRLNPFSIDSLLGNDTRSSTPINNRDYHHHNHHNHNHNHNQNRASTPSTLSNGRQSTTPTSPSSPISEPTSSPPTKNSRKDIISR